MLQHIDETRKSRMFNVKVEQCSVFLGFFCFFLPGSTLHVR